MKGILRKVFKLSFAAWFLGASSYFTVSVLQRQQALRGNISATSLKSGASARLEKVIDGDEVFLQSGVNRFTLRIRGIKSFDPKSNDVLTIGVATATVSTLRSMLKSKDLTVRFEKFQTDPKSRLIADLYKDRQNVAKKLISKGLTLVYTKFPFPGMKKYLKLQAKARKKKKGLWQHPKLKRRALKLQKSWSHT